MTENTNDLTPAEDELVTLKGRADLMDIKYHPSIGAEKLRMKIEARLSGEADPTDTVTEETKPAVKAAPKNSSVLTEKEYKKSRRAQARRNATKLVRIRVACMNPNKKEWEGEIISVGSARLGTFKKFVPFNVEEGYHVPQIIYHAMKERKCTVFHTVRLQDGAKVRKGRLVNEFAIEVLPPLTAEELKDLANQQAMANSID